MVAARGVQTFALDTTVSRRVYSNRRTFRFMAAVAAMFFLGLTIYGALGLPHALTGGGSLGVYLFALVLGAFLTLFTASAAVINAGKPADELTLSEDGLMLRYSSFPRVISVAWTDRRFKMIIRDFRGHPSPASDLVAIERVGRTPFWMQPPTSPLSPPAVEALLAAAGNRGLKIS